LLVLAHLRNGDTYTRLAAGFRTGTTTAWRYIREAVDLLAAKAEDLAAAMRRVSRLAYAILDGTLIPIDRVAEDRPYYSGKHKRHGVNVQILPDPAGGLVWASPALPGAVHDLGAARAHGLITELAKLEVMVLADRAYQGAGASIRTPFKRHHQRPPLSQRQEEATEATPASGRSANGQWPLSRPGRCWPSFAAAHTAPPRSFKRSSCSTPSEPTATHDEKGSLIAQRCQKHDHARPWRPGEPAGRADPYRAAVTAEGARGVGG
jgi:hypothetical protein